MFQTPVRHCPFGNAEGCYTSVISASSHKNNDNDNNNSQCPINYEIAMQPTMNRILLTQGSWKPFTSHALSILLPPSGTRGYKPTLRKKPTYKKSKEKGPGLATKYIEKFDADLATAAKAKWLLSRWWLRIRALREIIAKMKDEDTLVKHKKSLNESVYNTWEVTRCQQVIERLNIQRPSGEEWSIEVKKAEFGLGACAWADLTIGIGERCVKMCYHPDMLGFVLAHEMSHVILRHFDRRLKATNLCDRRRYQARLLRSVFPSFGKAIRTPKMIIQLASVVNWVGTFFGKKTTIKINEKFIYPGSLSYLLARRSDLAYYKMERDHEDEADDWALTIMKHAGMDLSKAIDVFLAQAPHYLENEKDITPEQYLTRTHPLVC